MSKKQNQKSGDAAFLPFLNKGSLKKQFEYVKSRFWEPDGPGRYGGMDSLRGLCCILMALFHLCYALVSYFGTSSALLNHIAVQACQILSSRGFILLAGMACRLSRSNLRRGAFTLACAMLVTLVSFLWQDPILFGVLHFMGCAAILYALCKPLLEHVPPLAGLMLSLLLYFAARQLFPMHSGVSFLFPLGLQSAGFYSADYYPLLPYFFWFLAGSYLMPLLQESKGGTALLQRFRIPFVQALGRNALLFYVLHQPLIIAALTLLRRFQG